MRMWHQLQTLRSYSTYHLSLGQPQETEIVRVNLGVRLCVERRIDFGGGLILGFECVDSNQHSLSSYDLTCSTCILTFKCRDFEKEGNTRGAEFEVEYA